MTGKDCFVKRDLKLSFIDQAANLGHILVADRWPRSDRIALVQGKA
jgi:hypothetical protein